MPTFDYQCKDCKYIFDEFVMLGDDEPNVCPECGEDIKKIITKFPGVIYKGSGFPTNDAKIAKDNRDMVSGKKV